MEWYHLQIPMVPPPLLSNQAMMQLCKTSDVGISDHVISQTNATLPPPPTPSLQSDIPPSSYRTKPGHPIRQAEGMLSGLHRSWRSERRRVTRARELGTTATVITLSHQFPSQAFFVSAECGITPI